MIFQKNQVQALSLLFLSLFNLFVVEAKKWTVPSLRTRRAEETCDSSEIDCLFRIRTDVWAYDINLSLTNLDTGEILAKGKMNRSFNREYFEYQGCVDSSYCYEFEYYDSFGDGLLTEWNAGYEFLVDGEVIMTSDGDPYGYYGDNFGESVNFGNCDRR